MIQINFWYSKGIQNIDEFVFVKRTNHQLLQIFKYNYEYLDLPNNVFKNVTRIL